MAIIGNNFFKSRAIIGNNFFKSKGGCHPYVHFKQLYSFGKSVQCTDLCTKCVYNDRNKSNKENNAKNLVT